MLYNKEIGYGQYDRIKRAWNRLKKDMNSAHPHSGKAFAYQRLSTFMFLYDKVFNKDIKCPIENIHHIMLWVKI